MAAVDDSRRCLHLDGTDGSDAHHSAACRPFPQRLSVWLHGAQNPVALAVLGALHRRVLSDSVDDMSTLTALAETCDRLVEHGELVGWVAGVSGPDSLTPPSSGPGTAVDARTGSVTEPPDIRAGGRRALDGPPMTADTQLAMSSSTKPIGGVLALRLVETGLLDLDDPVDRWLPELAQPHVITDPGGPLDDTVPADVPITLRHLLTMTPGFGWVSEPGPLADGLAEQGIAPGPWPPDMSPDEFMARLGALPLAGQPGTSWRYHTSSEVIGVLLSRATRRSVGELLDEHVLGPLGMTDTAFVGDPERTATPHTPADGDGLSAFPVPARAYTEAPRFESLAAGLVSTVPDQLAFLGSLVGSSPGLLGNATLTDMRTDQLTAEQRATAAGFLEPGCGWGHHVEVRPQGHVGWAGGLGTIGYADPRNGRAAFLATQVTVDSPGTAAAFEEFWSLLG